MKISINYKIILLALMMGLAVVSCKQAAENASEEGVHDGHAHEEHGHEHDDEGIVRLNSEQAKVLNLEIGPVQQKVLGGGVRVSGSLKVPPQNEATVTAIFGANIQSIEVIEGDDVRKGQVLAYLSHPNITQFQSEYLDAYSQLEYLKKNYERQEKLYKEEVASGKGFEQVKADYLSTQGKVASHESQLRQLGLNPKQIQEGKFYDRIPVVAPIEGSITAVEIKTGQYVSAEKDLFEIVNTHHIHADLMVFEKDVYKVEKGQMVEFEVKTIPGKVLSAEIFSVGKIFEEDPKAVHVHADIVNKSGKLIPGMYIQGHILTDSASVQALPEAAIAEMNEEEVVFMEVDSHDGEQSYKPMRIKKGEAANGWVAIEFYEKVPADAKFVQNGAYYLVAEMQKSELEHSH
ncbi:efflux RND transporter periplasmic adaptor subunit [Owenweeksia hongkongensis]|uniref:efflux RND transporter periplasmic adaptor subunit n=1 Tax=Owenweeksia hongkongensis TaxID=253245 RepID=UPI003A953AAF